MAFSIAVLLVFASTSSSCDPTAEPAPQPKTKKIDIKAGPGKKDVWPLEDKSPNERSPLDRR